MTLSSYEQIHARIDSFVAELEQLVRQAALESVQRALGAGARSASSIEPRMHLTKPASSARPAGIKAGSGQKPAEREGKRTSKQLEALTDALLKFIEKHPGSRMEQIAAGMRIASKELTLPLRNLKLEGHLKTKGEKRATAYYAK